MPSKYQPQDYDTPGPSHYTPRDTLVAPNNPKYSIQGRESLSHSRTLPYPSPADRDVRLGPAGFGGASLTRKGNTWPYAPRENPHFTPSPGPNLLLTHSNLDGSSSGRWTLASRNRQGVVQGHPGPFAQPVDTHGFTTPGPAEYRPHPLDVVPGQKKSFGVKLGDRDPDTGVPGPGSYEVPSCFDSSSGPVMGERLAPLQRDPVPPPNSYHLPDTNSNIKYSLHPRNSPPTPLTLAAPNTYTLSTVRDTGGKYSRGSSLQYKSFESRLPTQPDPSTYDAGSPPFPSDTSPLLAAHCRPVFPDVLQYPEHVPLCTPSPSTYTPSLALTRPLDPLYSFGQQHHQLKQRTPAPNAYNTQDAVTSKHTHPPSYSMRPHTVGVARKLQDSPSPSQYPPAPNLKRSAPLFSFGVKHGHEDKVGQSGLPDTLSPSTYLLPHNLTRHGVMNTPAYSIKGKVSPRVYNGFSNSSVLARLSTIS